MTHLSLTFLGSFQAVLGSQALTAFRSTKVQGLLLYLALRQQQPQARDVLAALFWPDEPEAVAKKNLRQSLYQLRQVLSEGDAGEQPHLLVTRTTAQFNGASAHTLDVTTFVASLEADDLEQAAAVYAGELVPGFTCDSLPFETWLREQRERLHRLALEGMATLAERWLARAEYRRAEEMAQRQLACEPWREEAYRQLMQALALRGERSAALAQYEACRAVLAEELGAAPAAETEALAARIRAQGATKKGRGAPGGSAARRRLTTPFAGRQREHGALARAYRRTYSEGAQVVVLVGEAGIGKTRLAEHFLAWATAQGADVLRGRAFETSGRLSYHPLTQALRRRLERENAPEDLLSDLWLTQLTRILPELRDRYPDLPEPTQEASTARQHLFEAIARLGQALAARAPLVLFLDDWHWADAASLDVLQYALLRWSEERVPILVLLTLRQEAVAEDVDLRAWLAHLRRGTGFRQHDLLALSGDETEELIRTLLTADENGTGSLPGSGERSRLGRFSRWLFEETEGQPFFLVETLKVLADEGLVQADTETGVWRLDWSRLDEKALGAQMRVLPGVQEIIRGWLARISQPAGQMLAAAAVLGPDASFDRLCHVAGLAENEALTALDELLTRQLLLEDEEAAGSGWEPGYGFLHQKLADAVYEKAGAARRRILHRRAFETLQATGGAAAELAHHANLGGLVAEAIRYSIAAGGEAMGLLAVGVGIAHLETAWQMVEKGGWPASIAGAERQALYTDLGRGYELTEAWSRAEVIYRALIAYSQSTGATALECLGFNRLATVAINGYKEPEQARAFLEQARAVAEASGDQRGLAETEWNLSVVARQAQQTHLAREHGERALAIARELGHPQLLARCLNSLAYVRSRLRQWDTVGAYAEEARALYAAAGNRIMEADCKRVVGWTQMYSGRPQDSVVTLRETLAFSREIENLWGEAESAYRLGHTLLELGQYGEAIRLAIEAVKLARREGQPTMVLLALSTLGSVQRTVLALDPARKTLLEVLDDYDDTDLADWALAELCAVHALKGEWDKACHYALEIVECRAVEGILPMGFCGWYQTEALLRGGSGDLARQEVARLGRVTGNNRRYRLPWHRSQAVLARWDDEEEAAADHLQAALALAREMELPGEQWPLLGELAALYAARGEEARAADARQAAAGIVDYLAASIDEEEWRAQFVAAKSVQLILGPESSMQNSR